MPKTGNRDCAWEAATFNEVCNSDDSMLATIHGHVVSQCRCKTDIPKDLVKSSFIISGDSVMCCPIPNSVEKFPKGSTGMVEIGRRLSEWGKSVSSPGEDGPSHRANFNGTDTFPPSAKDTVHMTDSDRIKRIVVVLVSLVCSDILVERRRETDFVMCLPDGPLADVLGEPNSPREEL